MVKRGGVYRCPRLELHMAHESSAAFKEPCRIWQRCALKETDVDVRRVYADIGERDVAEAGGRLSVVHEFADFITAVAHRFEPFAGDGAKFSGVLFHPRVDAGGTLDGAIAAE